MEPSASGSCNWQKTDVLLLDDWGMAALDSQTRADLLEIIDVRAASRATVINDLQLLGQSWHPQVLRRSTLVARVLGQ